MPRTVVESARPALERMKFEVAQELGIQLREYNGDMPARDAGKLGGNVVRRLIQAAEQQLASNSAR